MGSRQFWCWRLGDWPGLRVGSGEGVKSLKHMVCTALALGLIFPLPARGAAVTVTEGTIELPTYALGVEDPNPAFSIPRGHNIYPYALLDDLTDRLETKTYRAIFLENDFLKATILPQMGGRLYSLFDKVSGREVFYRNNVVKYGLVALRGAWISGGIEFNFPDGHTVVTVSPVASTLRENPDGSATVVVGDMDQVTGMHWEVALTVRPGQCRLEQHVTLFNPTPLANPYWFWANAAVPATEDMQFIYPMREANPHSRTEVWTYPVWRGVDYSWYKKVRQPTSLFGRQVHRNFFGAYYRHSDYGVVHVADFRQVPGKKVWTWGVAGDGLIWTDLLTDRDGPYNEIQSGRYETQLNHEFMAPRRVESWTEYWYPVRGLRKGFVEATSQIALNVDYVPESGMSNQRIDLLLSPTEEIPAVQVRASLGARTLKEFGPLTLRALEPHRFSLSVDDLESARRGLTVDIESADKRLLLHWSAADPVDGNADFVPATGKLAAQPKPVERMTVEELFLLGLDQEKDGQEEAAQKTYDEVLQRDPGYVSALLKKAWWNYRASNFPAAEAMVARAFSRNAFDPAMHYAAGVIYRASSRSTLAADALWASVHYGGPPASALAQLGEIAIQQKNYAEAARLLRESLSYNREDALALADLAVALRLGGKTDDAVKAVDAALQKMPLLPFALAEAWRVQQAGASLAADPHEAWRKSFRQNVQAYLEVASWYRSLDDLESADAVLQAALKDLPGQALSPLVYYYLASDARLQGRKSEADDDAARAASAGVGGVFPQRTSDADVLVDAVSNNSFDTHALYELGNFLFAHGRYENAAQLWLQALGRGFDYSVLERNLGVYAWRVKKDLPGAAAYYSKAIQLAPDDYRLYRDLDEIYFQLGDNSRRAKLFAGAPPAVLERDTIRARRALLLTQQKQYGQALELFWDHHFKPWEGGEIIRQIFVRANVEEGRQYLEAQKLTQADKAFRRALEYPPNLVPASESPFGEVSFRRALQYPPNLGVGKPDKPHDEEALFWLGEALQAEGKTEEARQAWQQAVGEGEEGGGVSRVYAALGLRRLGKNAEAERILNELANVAPRANPSAHDLYVAGLAEHALGHPEAARDDFRRALDADPLFWQARLESERELAVAAKK